MTFTILHLNPWAKVEDYSSLFEILPENKVLPTDGQIGQNSCRHIQSIIWRDIREACIPI